MLKHCVSSPKTNLLKVLLWLIVIACHRSAVAWYYSTACQSCHAHVPKSISSSFKYTSFFAATDACKQDCALGCGNRWSENYYTCLQDKSRETCRSLLSSVGESQTALQGVPCQFDDAEVEQCVNLSAEQANLCRLTCTAEKDATMGLYAYKSDWNYISNGKRIWGKCQNWECSACESNLEGCQWNVRWLLSNPYGEYATCPYSPCTVDPVDEGTDYQIQNCLQDECVMMEEMCVREWRVCHQWCSMSKIPKCDMDREQCLVQYGLFPGPSEQAIASCDQEWDSCVASGLYDNASLVELKVETGKGTYAGTASCPKVVLIPENPLDLPVEQDLCDIPNARFSKIYKLWLPDYFLGSLSKIVFKATSRDGWLIKHAEINIGGSDASESFQALDFENIWLDGEPYDWWKSVYSGYSYDKEWTFTINNS